MNKNIGTTDRVIRIIAGIALISLFFILQGPLRWISLAGVVLVATAIINFCPIYRIIGFKGTSGQ